MRDMAGARAGEDLAGEHDETEEEVMVVERDERGRFAPAKSVGANLSALPTANTIEALRTAIDTSKRVTAQADGDIAALAAAGIRIPASVTAHRAYHLMRMRCYIDRLYTALNHGIEASHGLPVGDINPDHLP